jgi:hypothetical protein
VKIHLVTIPSAGQNDPSTFLVKAHTKAGAEKFVRAKFRPEIVARVPTQDELVAALQSGVQIEDATATNQEPTP